MGMNEIDIFDRCGLGLTDEQKENLLDMGVSIQAATRGLYGLDTLLEAIIRLTAKDISQIGLVVHDPV